ncbi:MAG: cytochrome b [Caulobacteraceae bacterium]|nr:cytochrome b [Caulobacteraceae bacterium]
MATAREHYSPFTLTLHWVTAALVVAQPLLVWLSEDLPREQHWAAVGLHKSLGVTVLVLTLVRLLARLAGHRSIPLPDQMPDWQKFVARLNHGLFYALLIGMPITGWAGATAGGRDVSVFGAFNLPAFPMVPADRALAHNLMELHEVAGFVLIGLIALHVAGALKHYVLDRDDVLQRMLPFLPRRA